jgi:hypothetical protein
MLLAITALGPATALGLELSLPDTTPQLQFSEDLRPGRVDIPNTPREEHAKEIDTKAELSIEERRKIQKRLKVRRKMVPVHQTLAFVAAGSIIAAEVVGMINSVALKTGAPDRDDLGPNLGLHRVLAGVATTAYFGAGIVAWTMPPALATKKPKVDVSVKKVDSGKLHQVLSIIHGIAMGTVVTTGILQANVATGEDWEALVAVHAISGFTAAGTVIASGLVIGTL